jgi:Raf kinase inhibitor-like YbhB/YbcL family protein
MGIVSDASKAVGEAFGGVRAGDEKLAFHKLDLSAVPVLEVSSAAFAKGQPLPLSATAEGDGVPPGIRWAGAPAGTKAFALIVEDPDAPMPDPFVHWIVYGIPEGSSSLEASSLSALRQGKNSLMKTGFTPASPPHGHGVHHYHFEVFALDQPTGLEPGVGRSELLTAMRGHVTAWGETVGTYERK